VTHSIQVPNLLLSSLFMEMLKLTFSEISIREVSPLFLVSASLEFSNKFVVANEYMKDHIFELRSYTHNLSSCEIKA